MKRLLIHIGYPKAASTTLQNSVFLPLHRDNRINFLGRAYESQYYGAADTKKEYKNWLTSFIMAEPLFDVPEKDINDIQNLSDDKINLLSEGAFTLWEIHESEYNVAERIKNHFIDGLNLDQVEILIILRCQTTLIMSDYVQRHRKIKEKSFSQYLKKKIGSETPGYFKVFSSLDLVKKYAELFGSERVHLILFEDLVNDRECFNASLAKVLGVETAVIEQCSLDKRLNKTEIVKGANVPKKQDKSLFRVQLRELLMKKLYFDAKILRHKVPVIKEEEKQLIFETFKEGNRKLAEEFCLDKEKMRDYGYFD